MNKPDRICQSQNSNNNLPTKNLVFKESTWTAPCGGDYYLFTCQTWIAEQLLLLVEAVERQHLQEIIFNKNCIVFKILDFFKF